MTFGKPVIATDAVGAAFDMIKNGENGFVVPEKNEYELYKSLKKIISDDILMEKMGKKSKDIINNEFNYNNMVTGFNEAVKYVNLKN